MYVVEHYRHSVARGLGKTDIARYDGFKDLSAEEAAEIGCDLLRQRGAVVVHREKNAFDCQRWIDRTAQAHQGVE
jgi:hypothetical protein